MVGFYKISFKKKTSTCVISVVVDTVVVQSLSHVQLSVTPWTAACQASLSFTIHWACSNSCQLSWGCHPTISSSVIPFSFCLQSFLATGSFLLSWLFASGGQSIGASASASVLPMNIHDWFPLGWTGFILLKFKGLSRVFSNTTVQKYQFFRLLYGPTLTSIHDHGKNHSFDCIDLYWKSSLCFLIHCLGLPDPFFKGVSVF